MGGEVGPQRRLGRRVVKGWEVCGNSGEVAPQNRSWWAQFISYNKLLETRLWKKLRKSIFLAMDY